MAKQHDMGNNETVTVGIVPEADGTFLAMTFSKSKNFKTRKGAEAWLKKLGFKPNGDRIAA